MKIIVIFIFLAVSNISNATNLPDFPFVVSTGVAEKDVTPDIATININIQAFDKESSLALKAANIASKNIIELIKKYNIDINQLEAGDIQKSTTRQRDNNYNQLEILGYDVSRTITLNIINISQYSNLMNDFISINNVSSLNSQFDHSDRVEIESELIDLASENAKASAKQMANSLGNKIHSTYAVSQASNFDSFFATFGASSYSNVRKNKMKRFDDAESGNVAMFIPKTINISQHINVVFRLK